MQADPGRHVDRPSGFLRVARKLFDGGDLFWPTPYKDRFSRGEAWLDLLQMAAFRDGAVVNGVRLNRGEFCGSLRWFAKRWSWSVKEVRGFLNVATRSGKISARTKARTGAQAPSVYVLVNYHIYNTPNGDGGTDKGTEAGTDRARTGHKDEEGKKGRKTTASPPAERKAPTPAHELVNHVITVGLNGRRPDGYAKQAKHANTLLKHHSLQDLLAVVEALPGEFPYNQGETSDVFDVGKRADRVLAKLQPSSRTGPTTPVPDNYLSPAELREIDHAVR